MGQPRYRTWDSLRLPHNCFLWKRLQQKHTLSGPERDSPLLTLRCTKPLLAKLAKLTAPGVGEEPPSTTRLGDWYANRLNIGRNRMVLCTSELSLLSVIVPAKDLPALPARLADALAYLLHRIGVPEPAIASEIREMAWVRFAPTASRRVLGHMNDFAFHVEHMAARDAGPLYMSDFAEQLAVTPCGSMDYARPIDVAHRLLSAAR